MRVRVLAGLLVVGCWCGGVRGQAVIGPGGVATGGVAISADGFLQSRQTAAVARKAGDPSEVYVSLPGAIGAMKEALAAGKGMDKDLRYLHGLTRIDYVFVYPDVHDVVIAGPSEPLAGEEGIEPVGVYSGRPAVQLEDWVVAMQSLQGGPGPHASDGGGRRDFYGCSIDPPENIAQIWDETMKKYGNGPRGQLVAEMKKAIGPQQVKLFGVAGDSRVAVAMVAADYRLKRMATGLEPVPAGVGTMLAPGEASAPRIWFEPSYEPLLVSGDGLSYELRGARLKLECGAQVFDARGATEGQKKYAANFSAKMGEIAGRVDAVADLQNVMDCFMVASLIKADRLDGRAGVDLSWVYSSDCRTAKYPAPKTAETVVNISGNVIVQGGVSLSYRGLSGVERGKGEAGAVRSRPEGGWFVSKAAEKKL